MRSGDLSFLRFVIAGVINTSLTYLLYLLLIQFIPYIWAYSLTYVSGIALGYLLNAWWVFRSKPDTRSGAAYLLSYLANYLLGVAILWLLVSWLGVPKEVGPLLVVAVSVPVMYVLTRSIFRGRKYSESKTDDQ
ncbi:GtrA family protein [Herbaspirillum sp. YR522]|uniref:GtrA family protein n=1 Tax=Herbaspirillum sp. YR522 TaxID=1144342 RepID=UPI00026F9147|nr:GtrA family protein [Herbaspirillum sp. YR522]EJN00862.1 putative membrane protein [Herbaspirillum sp. YR522]